MILRDYLEAEEFLNESLFDSIIEEPLNEAFKSDIARKLAKSSIIFSFEVFSITVADFVFRFLQSLFETSKSSMLIKTGCCLKAI